MGLNESQFSVIGFRESALKVGWGVPHCISMKTSVKGRLLGTANSRWFALVTAFIVGAGVLAAAGSEPVVRVPGDIPHPQSYSLEELQKLPVTKVTARDHDGTEAEYTDVTVEELLLRAGAPLGSRLRGPALATAVVVHAAGRYQAVFSLAELDSGVMEHKVLLAWRRNNEPLPAAPGALGAASHRD